MLLMAQISFSACTSQLCNCSFGLACFFMQIKATEALQLVAERYVAEPWLVGSDMKKIVGVNKTLYQVTRAIVLVQDLLCQAECEDHLVWGLFEPNSVDLKKKKKATKARARPLPCEDATISVVR